MAWKCDRCGTLHTQNPTECRECGHQIFSPVSNRSLRERTSKHTAPKGIEPQRDQIIGTTPDDDYDRGPDVAKDGTLITDAEPGPTEKQTRSRFGGFLRTLFYKTRAILKSPFWLLRQYLIPILAFVFVFVVIPIVLYLLLVQ